MFLTSRYIYFLALNVLLLYSFLLSLFFLHWVILIRGEMWMRASVEFIRKEETGTKERNKDWHCFYFLFLLPPFPPRLAAPQRSVDRCSFFFSLYHPPLYPAEAAMVPLRKLKKSREKGEKASLSLIFFVMEICFIHSALLLLCSFRFSVL